MKIVHIGTTTKKRKKRICRLSRYEFFGGRPLCGWFSIL